MKFTVHSRFVGKLLYAASLILVLSGCAQNNISSSGSNWHEDDTIARDVAAQLSNPTDLTSGHGDSTVPAQAFVAAIKSWSTGQSQSLGAISGSTFGGASGMP